MWTNVTLFCDVGIQIFFSVLFLNFKKYFSKLKTNFNFGWLSHYFIKVF